ncbi:conserved hypothetical protein [Paraburkholderia graminis C4D1M]|uniref:Uncharacterized protein n=1 Tax=Paraburkholderia graminis (strain ATCC 700544 / DSM 17151 / LMG 18924 / NCIMB 13744 / C4D1M) TaxID=396598 RepID=B1FX09_PARG4|nr:conserved hypothetical protein [Paraburkholderia graminis C4D1M]
MGIDAQHAEVARHRRLRAERLRLDRAGFPKHFRCLSARDVPVDRQAVIVQHLDLVGVFGGGAEQRVVAPQQRERGPHERALRAFDAARVVRKREVAACVEAPRVGLAGRAPADAQRARAGLGEAPEIVRIGTGQLGEYGVEFVQCGLRRCARRRAACVRLRAQHRQQRALIARPQMRQLLGRLRVKRHRRHGARGQREIFVRNGRRGAVLAEMGAQRAVVIEERRRTGEFAQIVTLERRPEIAQRRAEARPHALGLGRIAGRERRKAHQHIGETRGAQPAGAAQRVRDAH